MALVSIRGGEGHAEGDGCFNALKLYTISIHPMTVWGREVSSYRILVDDKLKQSVHRRQETSADEEGDILRDVLTFRLFLKCWSPEVLLA